MFRKYTISPFAIFLLLAACTATPEPAADPIIVERPTITAASTSVPNTETPLPTPTAEATPSTPPRITPTPYTPLPTNTPTPTPQSFYEDVWVGGLLMSQTELWVANSSIPHVLPRSPLVPLQTADPQTAEQLNSLPNPWVTVLAQGDFYYNGPEDYYLVVESIELVNLPYSAETPLDATYHHTDPDFTFDYPAGWFITTPEEEVEGILHLNNVPPLAYERQLFIGTEYSDPTRYNLTVRVLEEDSIEAYLDFFRGTDEQLWDIETVEINGRPVPKITAYGLGYTITYLLELNDTILAFSDWEGDANFIERIISTVR